MAIVISLVTQFLFGCPQHLISTVKKKIQNDSLGVIWPKSGREHGTGQEKHPGVLEGNSGELEGWRTYVEASCHLPFGLKPHVLGACPPILFYIVTIDHPLPNPQVHVSREKLQS